MFIIPLSEPDLVEIKLQYHDPKGKQVVVWTFLESEVFQKDGVAVFLAQKYYLWDGLDKRWGEEARVFAVKAPELPIDISTEIAGRWAQKSGKDVKAALTYLHDNGIMNGKVNGDNLDFYMNGSDMIVSWDEISDMMRVVKENGAVHKDPELGTKCWEMEFRPVVQK